MSTLEGTLRLKLGRSLGTLFRRGLVTSLESGDPPLASLPEATALAGRIAEQIDGMPVSLINETVLDVPTTAHVLGGCCMGTSAADGVIDHRHRVFGYDGLYVIDGSAISANPGVNPSLTITALAERAMSFVPEKDRTET
jgi:cholesterol oxidase